MRNMNLTLPRVKELYLRFAIHSHIHVKALGDKVSEFMKLVWTTRRTSDVSNDSSDCSEPKRSSNDLDPTFWTVEYKECEKQMREETYGYLHEKGNAGGRSGRAA